MPRQIVTVQVGQCGNQMGLKFWDLALQEHASSHKLDPKTGLPLVEEAFTSFFQPMDARASTFSKSLPVGAPFSSCRARAIIIDMEEGVIQHKLQGGKLGELFDPNLIVSDKPGCGNNWGQGFHEFGEKYHTEILDKMQKAAEACDSLQGFFFMHSLGGGTGSGLGTYTLSRITADNFKKELKFSTCVFPSEDDDVNVSPYNCLLALNELIESPDCVLPIDNQALFDMVAKVENKISAQQKKAATQFRESQAPGAANIFLEKEEQEKKGGGHHYQKENLLIAHVLNNLTSSMRFEGSLNVDLNEISVNLVPYAKMHFLLSSLAPVYRIVAGPKTKTPDLKTQAFPLTSRFDQSFRELFDPDYQLISVKPLSALNLCSLFLARGEVPYTSLVNNVEDVSKKLKKAHWNEHAFKIGQCSRPPFGLPFSILSLSNNTAIVRKLHAIKTNFQKLFRNHAFLHLYQREGVEVDHFEDCVYNLSSLIESYQTVGLGSQQNEEERSYRFSIL